MEFQNVMSIYWTWFAPLVVLGERAILPLFHAVHLLKNKGRGVLTCIYDDMCAVHGSSILLLATDNII